MTYSSVCLCVYVCERECIRGSGTWTGLKQEVAVLGHLATSQRRFFAFTSGLKECITPLWPMFTMQCFDSGLKARAVYRPASWTGDTWIWSNKAVGQWKRVM